MATAISTPVRPLRRIAVLERWHLLSLDAPAVAGLWTFFLARQFGVVQTAAIPAALALAVWLLYAGDRIYDAMRGSASQERHTFHFEHRKLFFAAAATTSLLLLLLMTALPAPVRTCWLLLALPLSTYAAAVHLLQLRHVPKEPLVAMFFALATALPLLQTRSVSHGLLVPVAVCFGFLCWLNCAAIAHWENASGQADRCTAWIGEHFQGAVTALMLLSTPLVFLAHTTAIGLSILSAAACLLVLNRHRYHLSRTTVRALADAALLTPLAIWPLVVHLSRRG